MDIEGYNRRAWDRKVAEHDRWTVGVSADVIRRARQDDWEVLLTPTRPVPRAWFGQIDRMQILCLASGGGQQGPVLAAAGADVTVLDNSQAQLEQDRTVAQRESLDIRSEWGSMCDLSRFADESFDLVFHPVSNAFVPDVRPIWRESFRVLRSGGRLLAGFANPWLYLFDDEQPEGEPPTVQFSLPYSDLESLPAARLQQWMERGEPLEFSHTLEDQIAGQIEAGFGITGFYEDTDPENRLSRLAPTYIATCAVKTAGQ